MPTRPGFAVADELGFRPLALYFPLGSGALPAFPPGTIPPGQWSWDGDRQLDPAIYAVLATQQFANTDWTTITFPAAMLQWQPVNPGHENFVKGEINYLLDLMRQEREIYLAEILAQNDNASLYFYNLLGLSSSQRPWTHRLIQCALSMALMAVAHHKEQQRRARPSAICPGLMPPVGPPGHAAFPSGHATQSFLVAKCLKRVTRKGGASPYEDQLLWLAKRIAENRERAGLHYPSDSKAGEHLAGEILKIARTAKGGGGKFICTYFKRALTKAAAEW